MNCVNTVRNVLCMTDEDAKEKRGNPLGASTAVCSANVERIRTEQQMSLDQLSERLKHHGWPLSKTSLSKLLRGTRRIDVDDLTALAYALNVSVCELLTPSGLNAVLPVEKPLTGLLAGIELQANEIAAWLRGDLKLEPESLKEWLQESRAQMMQGIERDKKALDTMRREGIPSEYIDAARENLTDAQEYLADIEKRIAYVDGVSFLF